MDEKNFNERRPALIVLGIESAYDVLRDEPRYREMLQKLNLGD